MKATKGRLPQSVPEEHRPPGEAPTVYQIRVKGMLGQQWSDWFGGMEIEPLPAGETILTGPVADQAALYGIVGQLRDLNLPLISLVVLKEERGSG